MRIGCQDCQDSCLDNTDWQLTNEVNDRSTVEAQLEQMSDQHSVPDWRESKTGQTVEWFTDTDLTQCTLSLGGSKKFHFKSNR
jgi:hypothetical protein